MLLDAICKALKKRNSLADVSMSFEFFEKLLNTMYHANESFGSFESLFCPQWSRYAAHITYSGMDDSVIEILFTDKANIPEAQGGFVTLSDPSRGRIDGDGNATKDTVVASVAYISFSAVI